MDPLVLDERAWHAYWRGRVSECAHRVCSVIDDSGAGGGEVLRPGAAIEVKPSHLHGRGIYATRAFACGECVFIEEPLRAAQHEGNKQHASAVCHHCFKYVGTVGEAIGVRLMYKARENEGFVSELTRLGITLTDLEKLASGDVVLPASEKFAGPRPVPCPGGCATRVFCSDSCAHAAWNAHERLCCVGARGEAMNKRALDEFYAHARETNDIFILASQAVAHMCIRAMDAQRNGIPSGESSGDVQSTSGKATIDPKECVEDWARTPYAIIANALWWDCVATPEEYADDERGELEFRQTLQTLASDSLELLRHAWSDAAMAFPTFFELETYARLVGAFELNNLELVVEAPVENYFLAIDDAAESQEKCEAMKITQPLLDALDKDYDIPCLGTALYSVQSGMNHDCDPNAEPRKDENDITGACVIVARRDIAAGEEITISYIAHESMSRDERQDALADYGFVCRCRRCEDEILQTRRR